MPTAPVFFRPIHVIHIDDALDVREVVRMLLALPGYPNFVVHSFASLTEAVKAMDGRSTQQADCVLLDLRLTDSTGLDTLLKAVGIFGGVPIVVLTGGDDADTDMACRLIHAGADFYLPKYYDLTRLLPLVVCQAVARKGRPIPPLAAAEAALQVIREQQ